MEEFKCHLNIAGINMSVCLPYKVEIGDDCVPFLTNNATRDVELLFYSGKPCSEHETMVRERAPVVWRGPDYYRVERPLAALPEPGSSVFLRDGQPSLIEGYIWPGKEMEFDSMNRILYISEIETLFARYGIVNIHSAVIRVNNQAILFTAPSGTGKSTQAELWERYQGAEQLNGDRSLIRKVGREWRAFGSPFAGTSEIYRNADSTTRTIVVLRQAKDNKASLLTKSEAFRYLYSETVVPRWNEGAHLKIIDTLTELVSEVPVCILHCTPDYRAVEVLEQFLQKEGI